MKTITLDVNHTTLHVAIAGEGQPLLCLHGFPQNHYAWRRLIAPLQAEFQLIMPDLRGMGLSALSASGQDKQTLSEDMQALLQALGHSKVAVMGHDWGAAVAQRMALTCPENISHLICLAMPYMPRLRLENISDMRHIFNSWYYFMHNVPTLPEVIAKHAGAAYLTAMFEMSCAKRASFGADDIQQYAQYFTDEPRAHALFNLIRMHFQIDQQDWEQFHRHTIEIPTLYLGGEQDPFVPPDLLSRLEFVFKHLRFAILPDCGHWLPEEKPEMIAKQLMHFFHTEWLPDYA